MLILTYAAESTALRVEKLYSKYDESKISLYKDILDVFMFDTASKINKYGIDAICSFAEGDEQAGMMMGMKRFTKAASINVVIARRRIAESLIEANNYNL